MAAVEEEEDRGVPAELNETDLLAVFSEDLGLGPEGLMAAVNFTQLVKIAVGRTDNLFSAMDMYHRFFDVHNRGVVGPGEFVDGVRTMYARHPDHRLVQGLLAHIASKKAPTGAV
jgi:hypothetical protein